jgi:AbrB family looped-hinge helix DNA binding protein
MTVKVSLDRAGRVVLPKLLRDKMRLEPGDQLSIESEGERITLRPIRPEVPLKKEYGIWVYQGELSAVSIPELIGREGEKRGFQLLAPQLSDRTRTQ